MSDRQNKTIACYSNEAEFQPVCPEVDSNWIQISQNVIPQLLEKSASCHRKLEKFCDINSNSTNSNYMSKDQYTHSLIDQKF